MPENGNQLTGAVETAKHLAAALEAEDCQYALRGAIALGFWTAPRGTLDVDVTIFLPLEQASTCLRLLQKIGCEFQASAALDSISEHGFCQVKFAGRRLDVFLPIVPFYELARQRRKEVILGDQRVKIWDAETLCVFKMMFFRRKDIADVEQLLRIQADQLDTVWVLGQLTDIYGSRDPRISHWEDLVQEVRGSV